MGESVFFVCWSGDRRVFIGRVRSSSFVGNLSLGIIAVVVSCVTSAGAVYFERVVKASQHRPVGLQCAMSACTFLIPASPACGPTLLAGWASVQTLFTNVPSFATLFRGILPLVLSIVGLQTFGAHDRTRRERPILW